MKTNYVYDDDHVTITTGDIETHIETHGCEDDVVTIAWCELAAGIGLLHDQIIHQRETLDKLPKCWALRDGKLVQDCPVVPGMMLIPTRYNKIGAPRKVAEVDEKAWRFECDHWHWRKGECANSPESAEALALQRSEDGQNP